MTTETTEYNIFVRTSDDVILDWDRTRIAEALVRETHLDNRYSPRYRARGGADAHPVGHEDRDLSPRP